MKRMSIMGLCLAALCAAFALSAVSASAAAPEWAECAKAPKVEGKYTGTFGNKTCTEAKAEGKYLLKGGIGKGKLTKGKSGVAKLHNKTYLGDNIITCTSSKSENKIAPPNIIYATKTTYKGCSGVGNPCTTEGAKSGEIKTEALAGTLGTIPAPFGGGVGVDLANEAKPGTGPITKFSCVVVKVEVIGSLIGRQEKDINTINKEQALNLTPGPFIGEIEDPEKLHKWTPLVNIPQLEGGPLDILLTESCGPLVKELTGKECSGAAPSGQEQVTTNKGETLEVKA